MGLFDVLIYRRLGQMQREGRGEREKRSFGCGFFLLLWLALVGVVLLVGVAKDHLVIALPILVVIAILAALYLLGQSEATKATAPSTTEAPPPERDEASSDAR